MDKVERYREIIRDTILPLTSRRYSGDKATNEALFDKENDRYIVVCVGWLAPNNRVYFNLVHVDIINGKVWIQYDGTEDGIGYALEAAGIPKEDIVPGFHPENIRPYTGYGVA